MPVQVSSVPAPLMSIISISITINQGHMRYSTYIVVPTWLPLDMEVHP